MPRPTVYPRHAIRKYIANLEIHHYCKKAGIMVLFSNILKKNPTGLLFLQARCSNGKVVQR